MMKKSLNQVSIDQEYNPKKKYCNQKSKRRKIRFNCQKNINCNKWTLEENIKFLEFVKSNKDLLLCPIRRKAEKVFLQLSQKVKTRSPDQCRSHHQKMIKYHNDLEGIISNLEKRVFYGCQQSQYDVENSEFDQNSESQFEAKKKCSFDTALTIEMEEEEEQVQNKENVWNLLNQDVWIDKSFLFLS